jgi:hypothetical protein
MNCLISCLFLQSGDSAFKDFTFDHSYWSFDPSDGDFATQEQVKLMQLLLAIFYNIYIGTSVKELYIILLFDGFPLIQDC